MLEINGTDIVLTRGDSAYIYVPVLNENGTAYEPSEGDKLYLQVRKCPVTGVGEAPEVIINGNIQFDANGVPLWYISPTDSTVPASKYSWDVELEMSNGDTCTYNFGTLTIAPENTVVAANDGELIER